MISAPVGEFAGHACWNRREEVASAVPRLRLLIDAIGRPTDLAPYQWAELYALVLEFEPDLIVELGRGYGNSTALFAEALREGGRGGRVVSLCLTEDWTKRTLPRLAGLVDADWLSRVDARVGDITQVDFVKELAGARRILVFWDAHGFTVAEAVLASLMPAIGSRTHVVVMHDLSDVSTQGSPFPSYDGQPLWRGNDWGGPSLVLGTIFTRVEQAIAAVDFTTRNGVPLRSATAEMRGMPSAQKDLLRQKWGEFYQEGADWYYFTLGEARGPVTYPARPDAVRAPVEPARARLPLGGRMKRAAKILLRGDG